MKEIHMFRLTQIDCHFDPTELLSLTLELQSNLIELQVKELDVDNLYRVGHIRDKCAELINALSYGILGLGQPFICVQSLANIESAFADARNEAPEDALQWAVSEVAELNTEITDAVRYHGGYFQSITSDMFCKLIDVVVTTVIALGNLMSRFYADFVDKESFIHCSSIVYTIEHMAEKCNILIDAELLEDSSDLSGAQYHLTQDVANSFLLYTLEAKEHEVVVQTSHDIS